MSRTYQTQPWLPEQDNQLRKILGKLTEEIGELQLATLTMLESLRIPTKSSGAEAWLEEIGELQLATLELFGGADAPTEWLQEIGDVLALIELAFETYLNRMCHNLNANFTPYFVKPDDSIFERAPDAAWDLVQKSLATSVLVMGRVEIHGHLGIDPKLGCVNGLRLVDVLDKLYRNLMSLIHHLEFEGDESEIIPTRVIQKKAFILPWLTHAETNFYTEHPFKSSALWHEMQEVERARKSDWKLRGSETDGEVISRLLDAAAQK